MSNERHAHESFLAEVRQEFSGILDWSNQGIYVYLDDTHWLANKRLADLLGYGSPEEMVKATAAQPFLDALVAAESRDTVANAYLEAVERKAATVAAVTWKKRNGAPLKSRTIFAPISFKGTLLALHFIMPV